MTRKVARNYPLGIVAAFFAILTLLIAAGVLAQTMAADRPSEKANAGRAPAGAVAPAQALGHRLLPGDTNGERALAIRPQKNKPGAGPLNGSPLIFLPAVIYSLGGDEAYSVAVADVNGDGKPDLVLPNSISDSVSVLLGNGDGTFQAAVTYGSGGGYPDSVAIADVNDDGKPDVLVANSVGGSVGVLLGNGDGTFQPAVSFGAGNSPISVAMADVNGDGKPDLLVADQDGNVGVLLDNGDGTFQTVVTYGGGGADTSSVAVADVNRDGKPDLVVASYSSSLVGVLLGNGDGTFQTVVTYGADGAYTTSVAVADVNRDGKPDLVVANYASSSVGVLLGNGDGTFQPAVTYSSGALGPVGPASVAAADVNGDGNLDLLVANEFADWPNTANGTVGVLFGNGDGTFQPAVTYSSGATFAEAVAVADVNGDSQPDIVVASAAGVVSVLLNNYGAPPTTTSLASSVNPADPKQVVTYTAAVTSQSGGALNGTVTFQDGSTAVATVTLANNQAAYSTSYKTPGTHAITASYSGVLHDAEGSRSATLTEYVRGSSKTVLTTSGSPSFAGQPVTFTATVTSKYGTIPDGELVTFYDGTTTLASVALAGGTAAYTTSSLSAKTHAIKATYAGDLNFKPSSGSVTQVVNKYPTTTALTSSLNPSAYGQAVTFTATVTPSGPYAPTGKVKFWDGTLGIGTATVSGGVAKLTKSTLAVGTHPITAEYLGDAFNAKSTSPVLDQVVQ